MHLHNLHTAGWYGPNQSEYKKIEVKIPFFQAGNDSNDTENYTQTTYRNATSSQAHATEKFIE